MAALAADRRTIIKDGFRVTLPVAAATTIYDGSLVCADAAGNAVPAAIAANYQVMGIAAFSGGQTGDNSTGGAGDISIDVMRNCNAWLTNVATGDAGALTAAMRGEAVYAADDASVRGYNAVAALTNVYAGIIIDIDATDGVEVELRPGSVGQAQVTDLTVTDDLVVGDDASVAGKLTVGETLTQTGVATFGAAAPADFDGGLSVATGKKIAGDAELLLEAAAGSDARLETATGGGDIILNMGSDAATELTLFTNDSDATVASVDATGDIICKDIDPTGDIHMDAGKAINCAPTGTFVAPYNETTTGGAPDQAQIVAAFGADDDGKCVVLFDDTPGVVYWCFAEATTGWYYVTGTVGAP